MSGLILTTVLAPIIVAITVLIVEYWVVQPLRDLKKSSKKPASNLSSFWQSTKARYKFIGLFFVLFFAGTFIYRYAQTYFKCELMTIVDGEQCFQVYADRSHIGNHFFPTGFMGDVQDVKIEETTEEIHSGSSAIKVVYEQSSNSLGWAGIVWQFPANNWGRFPEGYDLRGNRYITFWAKSTRPDQVVRFSVGGTGRNPMTCERDPSALYPESLCPTVEVTCKLTNQWFKYAIALPEYQNLQHIINGFSWTSSSAVTFYLDEIFWVSNPALPPWEGPFICDPIS